MELAEVAAKVDLYITTRDERKALDKKTKELKTEESRLKAEILTDLRTSKAGACAGTSYNAAVVRNKVPQAVDWDAVRDYIIVNDAWDLLQNRLSPPAIRLRWEDGKEIPGIVEVTVEDLSITKLKRT